MTQLERILKMNLFFPFQTNNYGKFSYSSIDTRRQFYAFKAHNNERRQLNERQRENRSKIGNNWFLIIFSYVWNMVANEKASRENIKHLTKRQDRSTYEHFCKSYFPIYWKYSVLERECALSTVWLLVVMAALAHRHSDDSNRRDYNTHKCHCCCEAYLYSFIIRKVLNPWTERL